MIRKAVKEDIKDIMEIIKQAVAEMESYGSNQWDENYPQEKDFLKDIEKEDLFALERDGELTGFVCINKVQPVEYNGLNWSSEEEALVIHRMAVSTEHKRKGIGTELIKFAEKLALDKNISYLKTDTYSMNANMNAAFKKCGYNFVGEMNFSGKEKHFNCYDKILSK